MASEIEVFAKRQDRIEQAIERLTDISADLNKMLAVQEQRLGQYEKTMSLIEEVVEKRREEYDLKIDAVYNVMRSEDKNVLEQIEKMRKEQKELHDDLSEKINKMEKIMWTYLGGFSVLIFLITYGPNIIKLFDR